MTPPKRKPGRPLRFPARVLVYVTDEMKAELEAVAQRHELAVPDVVRMYLRRGLAQEIADSARPIPEGQEPQ